MFHRCEILECKLGWELGGSDAEVCTAIQMFLISDFMNVLWQQQYMGRATAILKKTPFVSLKYVFASYPAL